MFGLSYVKLAVAGVCLALVVALFGLVGWLGYRQGSMTVQARWDTAVLERKKGEEAALKAAASAIAKIEVKSETHIQPLRTEIRTNTVYRDCMHSIDGMRHLNSLILGESIVGGAGVSPSKPAK